MSDTFQVVEWALGYSCALRTGEAMTLPKKALAALSRARIYSRIRKEKPNEVLSDVCVTGCSFDFSLEDPNADDTHFPMSGFVISQEFQKCGGAAGLEAMCGKCPANATPSELAGCAGHISQWPYSGEMQIFLEQAISRLGLKESHRQAFLATNPIWFGLWANSPLSDVALRVLRAILLELCEGGVRALKVADEYPRRSSMMQLIAAIDLAQSRGLPLYVSMTPPGHVDFGIFTIYPHCPICKAEADLPRFKSSYPKALYTCAVCGHGYRPSETASSERDQESEPDLRELLGNEFPAFAKAYLIANGMSGTDAEKRVLEEEEKQTVRDQKQTERDQELAEMERRSEANERFVTEILFAGLHPRRGGDDGDERPRIPNDSVLG
ncbi:MAG TPA: hypothetical protein VFW23_14920, partial [Tepidisphaeraceae bacterium]|nr:hypothetical protein [Tepidisphaeraceae bacterium]